MSRINTSDVHLTHEGAPAKTITAEQELRRSIMACLLWEDQFYEDGRDIAARITHLVPLVNPEAVAAMAVEARTSMKLRHAPLLIVREMARLPRHKAFVGGLLPQVIQRPDELAEFLAIYWKVRKQPISKQVKIGLARAFANFNEYQLAKYNRDAPVKLRDVMFLAHPKPAGGRGNTRKDRKAGEYDEAGALYHKLAEGNLETPDTWEVEMSAHGNTREGWERLLREHKLGALALLRNLRNMAEKDVDELLIRAALSEMKVERVLPFRFIAAARYAPQWESWIEPAMMKAMEGMEKLAGKTILLVDVSGSMDDKLSGKSDMIRMDAACGLAILAREQCESVAVYAFSNEVKRIPDRHGFALRDAVIDSMPHRGTYLGKAIESIEKTEKYNRMIVITDEQSHDRVPAPNGHGYMINVASYRNGVDYGAWVHIDGWSEATINYIQVYEAEKFD